MEKYILQSGRWGNNWENFDEEPDIPEEFLALVEYARGLDTYGSYHYRIVGEDGNVMWTRTIPYEGVSINMADSPSRWLDTIREDYGIEPTVFMRAVLEWASTKFPAVRYNGKDTSWIGFRFIDSDVPGINQEYTRNVHYEVKSYAEGGWIALRISQDEEAADVYHVTHFDLAEVWMKQMQRIADCMHNL